MFIRMGDLQSNMTGQQQMNAGFFGVDPSIIVGKIVWSTEGWNLTPHGYGFELPSHNWNDDGEMVFTPSCYKNVPIENMLLNMSESERMGRHGPMITRI